MLRLWVFSFVSFFFFFFFFCMSARVARLRTAAVIISAARQIKGAAAVFEEVEDSTAEGGCRSRSV